MARAMRTVNGMTVAENTAREREMNDYRYSVFTKEEMEQPAGFRYPEMEFDSFESAVEFARSY